MRRTILALIMMIALPIVGLAIILTVIASRLRARPTVPRLVWGPDPIISNKYWSHAMRALKYESKTVMYPHYHINQESDFDVYIHQLVSLPKIGSYVNRLWGPYLAFIYAAWNFEIFHHPASGGFLGQTLLWRYEGLLLRWAGKKVVILPYGGDFYSYSKVIDPCLRHALLLSYPAAARKEKEIEERVSYWVKHADVMVPFFQIDGIGRWDMLPFSMVTIDTDLWKKNKKYSHHDGISGAVNIIHAPNHRGFKGTEFLVAAVDELRTEGLNLNLILLEGVPNNEVKKIMEGEADILVEQLIVTAYAMNGIEGMAVGLPVLANLENETYTRLFRRYSYLNECPILSTSPEILKRNLRLLVTQPALRESLGMAGRDYVEKYHSYEAAQYMFRSIYEKIYHGKDIDLMNMFHPIKSEYSKRKKSITHPLIENRLPVDRSQQC